MNYPLHGMHPTRKGFFGCGEDAHANWGPGSQYTNVPDDVGCPGCRKGMNLPPLSVRREQMMTEFLTKHGDKPRDELAKLITAYVTEHWMRERP